MAVLSKIARKRTRSKRPRRGRSPQAAGEVRRPPIRGGLLARHLDADPEAVLRATMAKFGAGLPRSRRAGSAWKVPAIVSLAEMDALWDEPQAAEG